MFLKEGSKVIDYPIYGLCSYVLRKFYQETEFDFKGVDEKDHRLFFKNLYKKWPKFSGEDYFPINEIGKGSPRDQYMTLNLYKGEQLNLRLKMAQWIYDRL